MTRIAISEGRRTPAVVLARADLLAGGWVFRDR
jgi:hypothetical protein